MLVKLLVVTIFLYIIPESYKIYLASTFLYIFLHQDYHSTNTKKLQSQIKFIKISLDK